MAKKIKAWSACYWADKGATVGGGCLNSDASQYKKTPDCTRKCTGYDDKAERIEKKPQLKLDDDHHIFVIRVSKPVADVQAYYGKLDSEGKFHPTELPHVLRDSILSFWFGDENGGSQGLSLSILTAVVGPTFADEYYQEFCKEFIAKATHESWKISVPLIKKLMDGYSGHKWKRREIKKGRDKGTKLPERCVTCGVVRQSNGRHHRCGGEK